MTKVIRISIYRKVLIHVETMKLALLLLMMSACLIDFVSARGVAVIGGAGTFQARIKAHFSKDSSDTYYVVKHHCLQFTTLSRTVSGYTTIRP